MQCSILVRKIYPRPTLEPDQLGATMHSLLCPVFAKNREFGLSENNDASTLANSRPVFFFRRTPYKVLMVTRHMVGVALPSYSPVLIKPNLAESVLRGRPLSFISVLL